MTDRFTEAVKELQEKSAFICVSCGHPHEIARKPETIQMQAEPGLKDRFSEAVEESAEKSAFVCESCGERQPTPKPNQH
ncbi:MAG: hypothetical protein IH614_13565 [Desulfuromonadales bacterium]|nr:hypothetical protein [Desulfuromonadales bacterium]